MQKIGNSTTTANALGEFTEGSPGAGIPATLLKAVWMNTIQRELINVIVAAGIDLDAADDGQLLKAIQSILAEASTWGALKDKPVTIGGFGITDAFTKLEVSAAIQQAIASLVASSPAALDTFKELADALGSDPNFATTMANALAGKASISSIQSQELTAFTTAGAASTFTLAPSPAIGAYSANQRFRVKFSAAAPAGGTLNVSGKGAKSLKQYDSTGAKVDAVIAAGQLADVEYDGTDMVLLDTLPVADATQTIKGIVRLATNAETLTGAGILQAVTPAGLESARPAKGRCTAWVNFNGATGVVRDSYNVSSVTRNAVGDYTVNFSTSFANANFAAVGSSCPSAININSGLIFIEVSRLASSLRVQCVSYDSTKLSDVSGCNISIFGGN